MWLFKVLSFQFPDAHLDGFSLYNAHDPEPVEVIHDNGTGIENTDIVIYIRAKNTDNCIANKVHDLRNCGLGINFI